MGCDKPRAINKRPGVDVYIFFGFVLDQAANAAEHISAKGMYKEARIRYVFDRSAHPATPTHFSTIPEKFL